MHAPRASNFGHRSRKLLVRHERVLYVLRESLVRDMSREYLQTRPQSDIALQRGAHPQIRELQNIR